jgi:hypothetical protein
VASVLTVAPGIAMLLASKKFLVAMPAAPRVKKGENKPMLIGQQTQTRLDQLKIAAKVADVARVAVMVAPCDLLDLVEDNQLYRQALFEIIGYSDTIGNGQPRPIKVAKEIAMSTLEKAHDQGTP